MIRKMAGLRVVAIHFPHDKVAIAVLWSVAVRLAMSLATTSDWMEGLVDEEAQDALSSLYAVLGALLGFLLASRISLAAERWWEGRSAWGRLIYAAINLSQQIRQTFDASFDGRAHHLQGLIVLFAYSCAAHLRSIGDQSTLKHVLDRERLGPWVLSNVSDDEIQGSNGSPAAWGPQYCLDAIRLGVIDAFREETRVVAPPIVQGAAFMGIDAMIADLGLCIGISIKVKVTSFPLLFHSQIQVAVALYLAVTPLIMCQLGLFSFAVSTFTIASVVAGMERMVILMQDPFAADVGMSLPLNKYSDAVRDQVIAIATRSLARTVR